MFQRHGLVAKGVEDRSQGLFRGPVADIDVIVGIHQHFRFHHGHDAGLLAQRRVAGQGMGVGFDTPVGRDMVADGDHGAPLGEPGAQFAVFGQAVAQPVQAFGYLLTGMSGQVLGARIHLDAGHNAFSYHRLREWHTVPGLLPQCLVEQDHAADELFPAGRGDQQFPVGAPVFLGGFDIDGVETFLYGRQTLVDGKNAFAFRHHGGGRLRHLFGHITHSYLLLYCKLVHSR